MAKKSAPNTIAQNDIAYVLMCLDSIRNGGDKLTAWECDDIRARMEYIFDNH